MEFHRVHSDGKIISSTILLSILFYIILRIKNWISIFKYNNNNKNYWFELFETNYLNILNNSNIQMYQINWISLNSLKKIHIIYLF